MVDARPPVDVTPEQFVEAAARYVEGQDRAGITDRRGDLQTVSDDAGVGEQSGEVSLAIAGDLFGIEVGEGMAEVLALFQDRQPRPSSLHAFEDQELEEATLVMGLCNGFCNFQVSGHDVWVTG